MNETATTGDQPVYPCGHLVGTGTHRSQDDADACAAANRAHAEAMHQSWSASLHPGWRGAKVLVSAAGNGAQRHAEVQIAPFGPGYAPRPSPTTWTVETSRAYRPDFGPWAVVRVERETPMRAQITQHVSFTAALCAAMADATTDLAALLEAEDAQDA